MNEIIEALRAALIEAGIGATAPIPYGTSVAIYSGRATGHGRLRTGQPILEQKGAINQSRIAAALEVLGAPEDPRSLAGLEAWIRLQAAAEVAWERHAAVLFERHVNRVEPWLDDPLIPPEDRLILRAFVIGGGSGDPHERRQTFETAVPYRDRFFGHSGPHGGWVEVGIPDPAPVG